MNLPRLIFTVTTGRSGTKSLQQSLVSHPDVCAVHEGRPLLTMEILRKLPRATILKWFTENKLPVYAATDRPIYLETSHLYCKGFLEILVELLGYWPDLIILCRKSRDVALSMFRLMDIPGVSLTGRKYYLAPSDSWTITTLPNDFVERAHPYQLCYWYTLEIGARMNYYIKTATGRIYVIHAEDIANELEFRCMLRHLDIFTEDPSHWKTYRQRAVHAYNKKYGRKFAIAKRLLHEGTKDIVSSEMRALLPALESEVHKQLIYR